MIWIALYLAVVAVCGAVSAHPGRMPASLTTSYFMFSLTGQLFALPVAIIAFVLAAFAEDAAVWLLLGAGALAGWVHWRNRRAGRLLLDAVGETEVKVPLLAGIAPVLVGQSRSRRIKAIAYGETSKRNVLDLVVPRTKPDEPMPILIHIHGGGWVLGNKNQQAKPLLNHLAGQGWLCVDATYRLGPKDPAPSMIVDVLKTIAWVKAHAHEYGGDPSRIAITGGSAGGHLTALAALAHDDPQFKPGFEAADCSVSMALPVYGCYDVLNRDNSLGRNRTKVVEGFLAKMVMPGPPERFPELWHAFSPLDRVRADAPPMLVANGTGDTIIPFEDARKLVGALRSLSAPVTHVELPGIEHAYDLATSALVWAHVRAFEAFLAPLANRDPAKHRGPAFVPIEPLVATA